MTTINTDAATTGAKYRTDSRGHRPVSDDLDDERRLDPNEVPQQRRPGEGALLGGTPLERPRDERPLAGGEADLDDAGVVELSVVTEPPDHDAAERP